MYKEIKGRDLKIHGAFMQFRSGGGLKLSKCVYRASMDLPRGKIRKDFILNFFVGSSENSKVLRNIAARANANMTLNIR